MTEVSREREERTDVPFCSKFVLDFAKGIPYIEMFDVFSEEDMSEIWKTIDALDINSMSRDPTMTGAQGLPQHMAEDPLGLHLAQIKQNYSLFLNTIYNNPEAGAHCRLARSVYTKWFEVASFIYDIVPEFRGVHGRGPTNPLLSYYGDGDRYNEHFDASLVSATITLSKDPTKFTGGHHLLEGEVELPFEDNKMTIWPGFMHHAVTPVSCRVQDEKEGLTRWSISLLI